MEEKLLKKCPKCRSDVFSGQRFCSSCGAEQKILIKTSEEIQQMRNLIMELQKGKSGRGGEENIPHLIYSFATFIGADTALKWAMGYATDEEVYKIIRMGEKRENNHKI